MIVTSLLDTDLYKFSMMQVVLHHYPAAQVEYKFKCRNPGIDLVPYIDEIRAELSALCSLRFTPEELEYLRTWRFIKSDFVDFLGLFQLNAKYVDIRPAPDRPGEIEIHICGPWLHTILFEVPLLAIINEVYFRNTQSRTRPGRRAGAGCATRFPCCATPLATKAAASPTTARAAASRALGTRKW